MSTVKCPECGGDIIVHYITPIKVFEFGENDEIKRTTSYGEIISKNPYLEFICKNNSEHKIEEDESIIKWSDKINDKFYAESKHID